MPAAAWAEPLRVAPCSIRLEPTPDSCAHPFGRQRLGLPEHRLGRFLLPVGAYLWRLSSVFTITRSFARTVSRRAQSTVTERRRLCISSIAIFFNVASPSSRTAASLIASGS
jgi:hypothetical protein